MAGYEALDWALEALAGYGPDLANGLTNHAPMAVEALCSLGRGDAVASWVEAYRPGLAPRPAMVSPIARDDWRGALGRTDRTSDWTDFFERQLAEGPGARSCSAGRGCSRRRTAPRPRTA